jgi:ribosomal protein S4
MTIRIEHVGDGRPLAIVAAFLGQFETNRDAALFIEQGNISVNHDIELAPERTIRPGDTLRISGREILAVK